MYHSALSFGNGWRLANRDVNLETNVSSDGFRVGTRLYLTLPTGERVGYTFAPVQQTVNGVNFYTPAFVPDASAISHTLQALETKLTKAGDHFFDLLTGDASNPADPALTDAQFRLTAPDGTIYKVHAANGITEQQFTDGKKFILSDSGITAVGTGETIQFIWNSSPLTPYASRLTSVTGPDGHRVVYSYDQLGNLVSARDLLTGDTARYGYDAQHRITLLTRTGQSGQVIQYPATPGTPSTPQMSPVKADLGAALTYLATPFTSTLTAGATDQLVFSVRPSEIISTNSTDVYVGVIIEANGSSVFPGLPTIDGLTALVSNVTGNKSFGLFRIEKEGLQLLKITGANGTTAGAYSVKLFIAGDANRDTKVDETDSLLIEAAIGTTAGAIGYTH